MGAGKLEEIRIATESLSESEKVVLADILLTSAKLTPEIDGLWRQELRRRGERLRNGELKTISFEEFQAKHETGQALP